MYLPSRRSVSAPTWVLFVGVYCPHWFVTREINTNIKLPLTNLTWSWRKHQDSREFLAYRHIVWIRTIVPMTRQVHSIDTCRCLQWGVYRFNRWWLLMTFTNFLWVTLIIHYGLHPELLTLCNPIYYRVYSPDIDERECYNPIQFSVVLFYQSGRSPKVVALFLLQTLVAIWYDFFKCMIKSKWYQIMQESTITITI